jgi:catechol 2,3-dioxygenase-like lactoylglutathione lyase family enzyme
MRELAVRRTRAALTAITLIPLGQPILDAAADLDATLARLSEQGIEPEKPPYSVREGGSRIVFVRDPDQYRVEIIEQPGAAG